jgi:predicted transposase/invertase (TIGR01784 family)
MKTKKFDPLNDYMFQKCMGEKGDEEQLLAFLNAVLLSSGGAEISEIEIIENKTFPAEILDTKTCIFDVRATSADGVRVNIEVQLQNYGNMDKRSLFYWSKEYAKDMRAGEDYQELPKVIAINIVDFNFIASEVIKDFHTSFHIREDKHKDFVLTDILEIHFIEMPKFRQLKSKDIKNNALHRWLLSFDKRTEEGVMQQLRKMDSAIDKFQEKMTAVTMSPDAMRLYEVREKARLDYRSGSGAARRAGISVGERRGRRAGRLEGEMSGILKSARGMKKLGIPVEQINTVTGLSVREIEEL